MKCPRCSSTNRADSRFCGQCGSPLGVRSTCPSCGREVAADQPYCDGCGTELSSARRSRAPQDPRSYTPRHLAERILTSRSAIEGERKHVTVLFADVAGYTSFAEQVDPEEVHALMDRCFQSILEEVHRFEGTINQFTGDGVMALFGAPLALEDAPARAVRAAIAIQGAVRPLSEEIARRYGRDFRMRMGVHTGVVVVGRIGDDLRMDYTAIGDTTNLANRLQQIAQPGSIVVSEATARLVTGFFELEDLGLHDVKGRREKVHAFRVLGERRVASRIDAIAESGLTPLVGRRRELERLLDAYDSANEGRGQVVFLVGEAGMGKSRLLYEFRSRLADRPHVWLEGHCSSYGASTAFHPIADAERRVFGINDRDDDRTALGKIEAAEKELGGGLEWTLPMVRELLSLPVDDERTQTMDAMTRRSETIRSLHARYLRACKRAPLIVVIEDLHWVDSASEDFLSYVADSIPAARILLVISYRPGYEHRFGDRSYHVRLALQPLSDDETTSMTGRLLVASQLPKELERLVVQKAEGNPFFIEELTRSLLEDGTLSRNGDRIELTRPVTEISIPDRIQDVLMARLDRLSEGPRRAIQIASVIGREFAARLLDRLTEPGDNGSIVIDELRALELVYEKAAHPEVAYMFKHALTHEVAYTSILAQRRRSLHEAVAAAIEELYKNRIAEHYEALAHHFTRAENWEKALDYHARAGAKAAASYANEVARDHYRQALDIAEHLGTRTDRQTLLQLWNGLADALLCISDFRGSGDACRQAAAFAPDTDRAATLLARAAYSYHWGHEYELAGATLGQVDELTGGSDDGEGATLAKLVRAFAALTTEGAVRQGAETARLACKGAFHGGAAEFLALHMLGETAEWKGDFEEALAALNALTSRERLRSSPVALAQATWFAGKASCCLGRYGDALATLHATADQALRLGDRASLSRLLNTIGWCYAEIDCHERAAEFNSRATGIGRELVDLGLVADAPELYFNSAINLAVNHVALGGIGRAREILADIDAELEGLTDPWMRWRYTLHLAHAHALAHLAHGNPERALTLAEREREGAHRHHAAKIEARALELIARCFLLLEDQEQSQNALDAGLEIARRISYPPVVWRSLALRAEMARRAGDRETASRHSADVVSLIDALADSLPEEDLQRQFRFLAERLVADPLVVV